jgi:NAD(P)-dependent dehydrogenase (short-subunit alcohol dehydrogenase family)
VTEFPDRVAVVTGAASGIGAAIASRLAERGIAVAALDLHGPAGASQSTDPRVVTARCDVTQAESVRACVAGVLERFGRIDILVNNAGVYPFEPFDSISIEGWRRVFAVNVEGVVLCCQAVIPAMRARGWGRIVNVGSNAFHMGIEGLTHYTASKGAVVGLTRSLAVELGGTGITVNVVAPTVTRTPGSQTLFAQAPEIVESVVARQAIRRAGEPGDVADAVALLCRDESGFITGQTLAADGGLVKL